MGLAIVTGTGLDLLTDIEGRQPYLRESEAVQIGSCDIGPADLDSGRPPGTEIKVLTSNCGPWWRRGRQRDLEAAASDRDAVREVRGIANHDISHTGQRRLLRMLRSEAWLDFSEESDRMGSLSKEMLSQATAAALAAADSARSEILPRFRRTVVEVKNDGSPVTEADRAAERAMRDSLTHSFPDFPIVGEEFGGEPYSDRPYWLIDPIDGTIAFARGIPLFSTIIALIDEGEPVVGLIDLPVLNESYVGWKGGGCRRRNERGIEEPVCVSQVDDICQALVAHGDAYCFSRSGKAGAFQRMAREIQMLRGYTDAFGHAMVLGGGVDAMVDLQLETWDAAATQVLVPEAGGRCETFAVAGDRLGLVCGAPLIVDTLMDWLGEAKSNREVD